MLILIILWVLFFISHSVLAHNRVKQSAQNVLGNFYPYYRLGYNLFSLLFLFLIFFVLLRKHQMNFVFDPTTYTPYVALLLIGLGVLIMFMAFRTYDLGEFSGISQLSKKIHRPEKLIIRGLGKYVRHPLYLGIIILVAGVFIYLPTQMNLVSLLIIIVYIYIGATLEEQKLIEVFGDEYLQYRTHTGMIFPRYVSR